MRQNLHKNMRNLALIALSSPVQILYAPPISLCRSVQSSPANIYCPEQLSACRTRLRLSQVVAEEVVEETDGAVSTLADGR